MPQVRDPAPTAASYADEVALAWSKQMYLSSVETLRTTSSTMVTLATGFFAIYFAIMKFLYGETAAGMTAAPLSLPLVAAPPVLLVLAVIFFAWNMLPIREQISLDDASSIDRARTAMAQKRWTRTIWGWGFFVGALALTIIAAMAAL